MATRIFRAVRMLRQYARLLLLSTALLALPACAAEPIPAAAARAASTVAPRKYPFVGRVIRVDPARPSFSLNGRKQDRVFVVTPETVILDRTETETTLDALPVGESVRGTAIKSGELTLAVKVMMGPKNPEAAGSKPPGKTTKAKRGENAVKP